MGSCTLHSHKTCRNRVSGCWRYLKEEHNARLVCAIAVSPYGDVVLAKSLNNCVHGCAPRSAHLQLSPLSITRLLEGAASTGLGQHACTQGEECFGANICVKG